MFELAILTSAQMSLPCFINKALLIIKIVTVNYFVVLLLASLLSTPALADYSQSNSVPLTPHLLSSTAPSQLSTAYIDRVKVDKSKRRMYLMHKDKIVKEYRIALGKRPQGRKIREGDGRTPEGHYQLGFVMDNSSYYRSMHINYPSQQDIDYSHKLGYSPGGNIKIHGLKNGADNSNPASIQSFDWTNGCIAITNQEMDEFLSLVQVGTPIDIEW